MKRTIGLSDSWRVRSIAPNATLDTAHREGDLTLQGMDGADWIETSMPREVHEILLEHGVIKDPTLLGEAEACLWVAEKDWIYTCQFALPVEDRGTAVYLHLKGLDTLVDVYLNGQHLAYHNDMYLPLRLEVTGRLRDENVLVLHFHSPHEYIKNYEFPQEWQGKIRPHRVIRKNETDFSDYLGPKPYLTPIGVYDDIVLEVIDDIELLDTKIDSVLHDGYDVADVTIGVSGIGSIPGGELSYVLIGPDNTVVSEGSGAIGQTAGTWSVTFLATVKDPALWWPRGYGKQPLYRVVVTASVGDDKKDVISKSIGLRRIEMAGPFEFTVNSKPITLWGAQPVQLEGITHRWNNEKSNRILDLVENSNMNAQRIWGACDRYDDAYYEETDRRGILVWQEFFHDYGMYPDTAEYRDLCRREAEFQVTRLRHHPSLLMWCGGNESVMGAEYDHPGAEVIGAAIFEEDYRAVCAELDPGRYYHVNSPSGGAFANDPLAGDTHSYTNTWYVPGADYPVMIAEEIRASPPSAKSMVRYFAGTDPYPPDYSGKITATDEYPWPSVWNKRASTEAWKKIPPIELFYDSTDLASHVHKFGAAHGQYFREILENNRRGRPSSDPDGRRTCMGHFVCRGNDIWPTIYGSILDYYLEPYIPYYEVARAYRPILLSFDVGNFINLWIINDTLEPVKGTVVVKLFDPRANAFVRQLQREVSVEPFESLLVTDLNEFGQFSRTYVLFAELVDAQGVIRARSNDLVDIEKHQRFPDAKLDVSVAGDVLTISTDRFARYVEISGNAAGDEFGWYYDDNFFDLLPGEVKKVRILGEHQKGQISVKSVYSSSATVVDFLRT
ncbi:beta-mannosidase [Demequina lutea]|uniref:Beta-mannosidase n=1 Tax=Demequina lutea TaxID=431489 RepID=A0A7Y9ZG75_9MICO|nr:glycoside hydrolase family 2 protein [Demequina lutea]NYI42776.1 hypothetical protein [Demequina lutea]